MNDVVHLYKDFPPVRGGIENHLDLLTRLLGNRGCRCEVLCTRRPGTAANELRGGVTVRRSASPLNLASTPLPPGFPRALWKSAARLVHLHYPWPPAEVAWLLGGRKRPLVVTVHCEVVRYPGIARLLSPLTQRVFAAADSIFVSSPALTDIEALARHQRRVHVVPLGVDIERFRPDPECPDPLPGVPRPRILFVGRLRRYKGLPLLAGVLARLPHAQLVVVGEGPEREGLEGSLRALGCRDRAHLLGEVGDDRLLALMQSSDAAVLPSTSRAEAFGLAIAEAQSCGLPAVSTEIGTGTGLTVEDHVSGRIVPPTVPDLAAAIDWCLDPEHAVTRRAAARAHAVACLDAERMVTQVLAAYERSRR